MKVSGPATPSAARPFLVCQSLRAFSVPGPNSPSAVDAELGLQSPHGLAREAFLQNRHVFLRMLAESGLR